MILIKGIFVDRSIKFSFNGLRFTNNLILILQELAVFLIFSVFLIYILYSALRELNLFINFGLNKSKNEFKVIYRNFFKCKVLITIPLEQIYQFNIIRVNHYSFTLTIQGQTFGLGLDYPIEYYQAQEIIQLLNKNIQPSLKNYELFS